MRGSGLCLEVMNRLLTLSVKPSLTSSSDLRVVIGVHVRKQKVANVIILRIDCFSRHTVYNKSKYELCHVDEVDVNYSCSTSA